MAGNGFVFINSTAPAFTINSSTANSIAYALESTVRFWDKGGVNRAVRIANIDTNDFYVNFGSSDVTAALETSYLIPGGVAEIFDIHSQHDFIATISTAAAAFNVGLGKRVG